MLASEVSPRSIRAEVVVDASVQDVWRVWTTSSGAQEFFAPKANISLAIGGPYEIYFDPANEEKSTKGMKLLSFAPNEMLSFGWTAPISLPKVREGRTWVVVQFRSEAGDKTRVIVSHYGWGEGPEWDVEHAHFVRGWNDLLGRLQDRFRDGPIDWSQEFASPDEQRKDGFSLKRRKAS